MRISLEVQYRCVIYLYDGSGFFLYSQINKTQEDVLQLDEEGVWVHCPVLPRSETRHHSLLTEKQQDKGGEVIISRVWCTRLALDMWYLKVLALKVALDRFIRCIEV